MNTTYTLKPPVYYVHHGVKRIQCVFVGGSVGIEHWPQALRPCLVPKGVILGIEPATCIIAAGNCRVSYDYNTHSVINPRRACAARVTVVVLCVCVCVSTTILGLQATRRLMSDTSSFGATRAGKIIGYCIISWVYHPFLLELLLNAGHAS